MASHTYKWDCRRLPGMSVDGQKRREHVLTSRYPAGFIVCLAAIALPVVCMQNANKSIGLHKRPPIPLNGILKHSLRIRTWHKEVEKSMQSTSAPQVFLFGQKAHPSLLQGRLSMQMGGVGLKNGVPY